MTSRQRLRRADRLSRRRRARAPRRRSPTPSCSTTARSTCGPTTRSCGRSRPSCAARRCSCAARAATCRRASRCRPAAARPILACGAELKSHVLPRARATRLGRPPHRRPEELRDAALVRRGRRALRAAVRGRRRRSSPTTCTPTTSRPATRSSARASSTSACSTTTRTSPPAWPSTGSTGQAVGAIFDGSGYGGDGTVWGGEILAGDLRSFERAGMLFPVRLPGGDAAVREPWRMACAWLAPPARTRRPPFPAGLAGEVDAARWEAVAELVAHRRRLAPDDQRRAALRRRRGDLRDPRARQPRGPGRGRARGRRAISASAAPTRSS